MGSLDMDYGLVRVVCACCQANYRLAGDVVIGKIVDFRCNQCGAVVEVNGGAVELVAPTRRGREPQPDEAAIVSETPAAFEQTKPPPPPTEAFAAQKAAAQSSMPPLSLPLHQPATVPPELADPNQTVLPPEPPASRRTWMAFATLLLAVFLGVLGKYIGSSQPSSATAASTGSEEDEKAVSHRLQPADFRGVTTDPAEKPAAPPPMASPPPNEPTVTAVEPIKPEPRKAGKSARSRKHIAAESLPSAEETTAAAKPLPEPAAAESKAPEPPAPESPEAEFNNEAARSALEDAAERAAICRDADTQAGVVRVAVTFAPTGRVTSAIVESGPLLGTPAGSCVASKFRGARVPSFSGPRVTVHKTLSF